MNYFIIFCSVLSFGKEEPECFIVKPRHWHLYSGLVKHRVTAEIADKIFKAMIRFAPLGSVNLKGGGR